MRTYIFGFWTYILSVWTYIWCLDLYFGCLNLYFGCPGQVGSAGSGRVGRAAGSGEFSIWGKTHFGNLYPKKNNYWLYYWILNLEYFLQKRRAPKNAAFWRAARAEISHMRPIQGRKLKLIIWVVSQFNSLPPGVGNQFPRRNQGAWTSSRVGTKTQTLIPTSG